MRCGVGHRRGSDSAMLWLWRRLVATAPMRPLAWEPPYAPGAAQEMAKRQKKKKRESLLWETPKLLDKSWLDLSFKHFSPLARTRAKIGKCIYIRFKRISHLTNPNAEPTR